jgi:predicted PurR-regulated permease PerM
MYRDLLDRHRSLRLLVGLVIAALTVYIVGVIWSVLVIFGDVILLFLLAWIISFILEPVSIFLRQRGMPRVVAVSLIYLALLVVVSGAIVLAVPSIEAQVQHLASEITATFSAANLPTLNQNLIQTLRRLGLSQRDAQNIVQQLSSRVPLWINSLATGAVDTATGLVTSLFNIIFDASLVVIISFYIMLDGDRLVESLIVRLPPVWIADVRLFQGYVLDIFGGFFRAQLIVAGIYAAFTWAILLALGQSNGLLVAIVSGIIMLLPFIGVFLAIFPPALLVLLQTPQDEVVIKLIILVIALAAAQHVVLNLMAPKIFGQHMGVPTLVLFAALLLGAKEGGVWGAFFAGPIVAVGYAMFEVFYVRFANRSTLFQAFGEEQGEYGTAPPHTLPTPRTGDATVQRPLPEHPEHTEALRSEPAPRETAARGSSRSG